MALADYNADDLRAFEQSLQTISQNIREIRLELAESGGDSVRLNFGSAKWHIKELVRLSTRSVGSAKAQLGADPDGEQVKIEKKSKG